MSAGYNMAIVTYSSTSTSNYIVGLTMGVALGYRISGGVIKAPRPAVQITKYFNSSTVVPWASTATSFLLEVSSPSQFNTVVGTDGDRQTVALFNTGTQVITVEAPYFSDIIAEARTRYTGAGYSAPPWTILPGQAKTFGLSYYSREKGSINEAIWFSVTETQSVTRLDLAISANELYNLSFSRTSYSTSTWLPNQNVLVDYEITPIRNGVVQDVDTNFSVSISGHNSWSLESQSKNKFTLRFNSWALSNSTASYAATATITAPGVGQVYLFGNTSTHSVNTALNYSSSSWISTLTQPDAIVGARIDYIQPTMTSTQTMRVLTIGVGTGGDGAPPLRDSNTFFKPEFLDIIQSRGKIQNAYWQTIYSFPLASTTTSRTFLSKDYKIKSQGQGLDYDSYYGEGVNAGTMFVVELDNANNVFVKFAGLRQDSGGRDAVVDQTLSRIGRVFYYYSTRDQNFRTTSTISRPWGQVYQQQVFVNNVLTQTELLTEFGNTGTAVNPTVTMSQFFRGFDNQDRIITSLVVSPT